MVSNLQYTQYITNLNKLYGNLNILQPEDPLPPSIYVYGDAATGKTKVITDVLELSSARFALVNCVECYTARLLLEPVLDKLLGMFMMLLHNDLNLQST